MGKFAKYAKKYKHEWEALPEFKGWLTPGPPGLDNAKCSACRVELRAHKTDLVKHSKTKMHVKNISRIHPSPLQRNLNTCGIVTNVSKQQKARDLQLASYIAMHTSIKNVDHLCELLQADSNGTRYENLRLHRTKCTLLFRNVMSPAIQQDLLHDIGNSYYSLIIDESTDISVNKYLCICIRYFSHNKKQVVTEYLGFIDIIHTTANDLYNKITCYLKECKLDVKKMIGLATDGANNLCGKNHSVYTLLKSDAPHLQLIKCVCHSIHICASKASEELPSSLDFLVRETYNWFCHSTIRRANYRSIFDLINIGDAEPKKFAQIIKLSTTRWLSRYNCVCRILEQWLELKTHFSIVSLKEKCYMSRTLEQMYSDDSNYMYLIFLKPVLKELNSSNLMFQHTDADIGKVYENLFTLVINFARRILKPMFLSGNLADINILKKIKNSLDNELAFLDLNAVDYGVSFKNELDKSTTLSSEQKTNIKLRCFNFLKTLCNTLFSKLPDNISIMHSLKEFHPTYCLNPTQLFQNLPINFIKLDDVEDIEVQWRNLKNINWREYCDDNLSDTVVFWVTVLNFENAVGDRIFKSLAEFALSVLSLPLSNAVVERVFSVMNIIKTKIRNRLKLETLDAILRIRINLQNNNMCCKNFRPTERMFELFNNSIYTDNNKQELNENANDEENIDEDLCISYMP